MQPARCTRPAHHLVIARGEQYTSCSDVATDARVRILILHRSSMSIGQQLAYVGPRQAAQQCTQMKPFLVAWMHCIHPAEGRSAICSTFPRSCLLVERVLGWEGGHSKAAPRLVVVRVARQIRAKLHKRLDVLWCQLFVGSDLLSALAIPQRTVHAETPCTPMRRVGHARPDTPYVNHGAQAV